MAGHSGEMLRRLRETPVEWYFSFDSDDDTLTFRAMVDGTTYKLRADPPSGPGYSLLVYGQKIADIALEEWPPNWELVGFGKQTNAGSLEAGPAIEAEQIRMWAERLCRTSGGIGEMAAGLGLEGTLAGHAPLEYATVEPPPPGASRAALSMGKHSIDTVRMEFNNCVATRAQLDSLLGQGISVPAVHPTGTFTIGYRVEMPGAPFNCAVFVEFELPSTPSSLASRVTFRRDPASEPPGRE